MSMACSVAWTWHQHGIGMVSAWHQHGKDTAGAFSRLQLPALSRGRTTFRRPRGGLEQAYYASIYYLERA